MHLFIKQLIEMLHFDEAQHKQRECLKMGPRNDQQREKKAMLTTLSHGKCFYSSIKKGEKELCKSVLHTE